MNALGEREVTIYEAHEGKMQSGAVTEENVATHLAGAITIRCNLETSHIG